MNISTTDAFGQYTKVLFDVYKERSLPTSFLRSFFPDKVEPTLELSIEVQRGFEKIAADVARGTDGNRNIFTRSTEKIIQPPMYREFFDATQLQLHDRLYGASTIEDSIFAAYINSVADHLMDCQAKIERSIELQCAQVLLTGTVVLQNSVNIDFKRKATSLVDPGGGQYFADNIDPFAKFQAGCDFLRQVGKSAGGVFNAILGTQALTDLLANTKFTARQNLFHLNLDAVLPPQRNSVGASLHGQITAGSYKVNLWTYPQFYDNLTTGVSTSYIDTKKVILIPENPRFKTGFGVVPQLIEPGVMPKVGQFIYNEFLDPRKTTREIDVQSCPIAVPIAIDQIYTFKAVA